MVVGWWWGGGVQNCVELVLVFRPLEPLFLVEVEFPVGGGVNNNYYRVKHNSVELS